MRKVLFVVFFGMVFMGIQAQTIDITGTVTSYDDNPISDAAVTLLKQDMATTTDANGVFRFPVATENRRNTPTPGPVYTLSMHGRTLSLKMFKNTKTSLQLYDLHGALVSEIYQGLLADGSHVFNLPVRDYAQKVYILRVSIGSSVINYTMVALPTGLHLSRQAPVSDDRSALQMRSSLPLPQRSNVVDTIRISHPEYYGEFFTFSSYVDTFTIVLGKVDWEKSFQMVTEVRFDNPNSDAANALKRIYPDPDAWLLNLLRQILRINYRDASEIDRVDDTYYLHVKPGPEVAKDALQGTGWSLGEGFIYDQLKDSSASGIMEFNGINYHEFGHMIINEDAYFVNPPVTNNFFEGKNDGQRYWCGGFPRTNARAGGNYDTESYQTLGFWFVWIEEEKIPQFTYRLNQYCKDLDDWVWASDFKKVSGFDPQPLWDEYQETFDR